MTRTYPPYIYIYIYTFWLIDWLIHWCIDSLVHWFIGWIYELGPIYGYIPGELLWSWHSSPPDPGGQFEKAYLPWGFPKQNHRLKWGVSRGYFPWKTPSITLGLPGYPPMKPWKALAAIAIRCHKAYTEVGWWDDLGWWDGFASITGRYVWPVPKYGEYNIV